MKRAYQYPQVTVKLRKTNNDAWYLILETYPVYKKGEDKPQRIIESLNRKITTPIWDRNLFTRSGAPKAKRDKNGVILCRSTIDQESCIFADNVRKLRQQEYDKAMLYPEEEREKAEREERLSCNFIAYFDKITYSRHPNSSDSIITNWERVGTLLKIYSNGDAIPFSDISVKWMENIKMFLLGAPQGGGKPGIISQSTASTYFAIIKAAVKQAFVDDYLTVDISEKVKGIPAPESQRQALTIEELNKLANTPCESDVLKRAFLFSTLTGMRHCDIKNLKWGQFSNVDGTWRIDFTQIKTSVAEYLPISDQAYQLCGEPLKATHRVFEGLMPAAWINKPLARWIEKAGITKHITFHCARHTYATLQLTSGTDIYTVSKMLGHTKVTTTQIYAKVVDEKKVVAANAIKIGGDIDDKSNVKE